MSNYSSKQKLNLFWISPPSWYPSPHWIIYQNAACRRSTWATQGTITTTKSIFLIPLKFSEHGHVSPLASFHGLDANIHFPSSSSRLAAILHIVKPALWFNHCSGIYQSWDSFLLAQQIVLFVGSVILCYEVVNQGITAVTDYKSDKKRSEFSPHECRYTYRSTHVSESPPPARKRPEDDYARLWLIAVDGDDFRRPLHLTLPCFSHPDRL